MRLCPDPEFSKVVLHSYRGVLDARSVFRERL
jgi:hypothetical protein